MLLPQFKAYQKKTFPDLSPANCHVLAAVSGGLDSTVLLHLLRESGYAFSIAHCNFKLRGEESNRDEVFVTALAKQYNVPLYLQHFDTKQYAEENRMSVQEAARNLRYHWFAEVVANLSSEGISQEPFTHYKIATAHHANDNIETLLMHFFRGTGISGLHGILPRQNNIIRPLLFARRKEIEQYALENKISWIEDSSNASDKYTRNFFRHQLLPLVQNVFANAEDNLLGNIQRFGEAEVLYRQAIELHKKQLLTYKGNEVHIPVLKLQKATPLPTIVWEIVKHVSFTPAQVADICNLLVAENGKYVASPTHRIIRNRNWLIVAPLQTSEARHILIEKEDKTIVYENGYIYLKQLPAANGALPADKNIAVVDATQIHYPLLLRKWKPGDYFYPLGMKKKKKLSKFFIDNKLSQTEKEKVWVIETNKRIAWVIGYRIDERCKVENSTKKVLVIENKITINS